VATTHQDESEIKKFLETKYWSGELYLDKKGDTYKAAGVTMSSAGCWKFLCSTLSGLTSGSSRFQKAQKGVKGNLKGSALKSSCMLLVQPPDHTEPLYYRPWAEEPAIGDIFAALGADEAKQQELQSRADAELERLAAKRAAKRAEDARVAPASPVQ